MKLLKEWGPFALLIIAMLLLRAYVWSPVLVEGHSMDPTLADKERLIIIKTASIKRQDIVVAKEYNKETQTTKNIVKRVIGMPGDTITFKNDVLTVNGKVVKEPYLANYRKQLSINQLQQTYQYNSFFQTLAKNAKAFTISATGQTDFTVKVPEGQYFLMGDNRLVSQDSRQVGTFPKKDIVGEAKLRIWPLKKIGLF
ncbi:signal peptidase I [Bacilli bacterium]|nr:signal peptidase I [Bacilli bacterium]